MFDENQLVKIKWVNSTKKWYESLGYIFTKNHDEFYVTAKELPCSSKVKINATCDYCGREYQTLYISIVNGRKIIQKDCCSHCTGKKTAEINLKNRAKKAFDVVEKVCKEHNYQLLTTIDEYVDVHTIVKFICPKHGVQLKEIFGFLRGFECSECGYERQGISQRFDSNYIKSKIEETEGNILLNPEEYETITTTNLKIQCSCGNIFVTSFANYMKCKRQCSVCSNKESKMEKCVKAFLEKHKIEFIQEKCFPDCKDKKSLPFDFYLPNQNLIIECNGKQHYEPIEYFGGNEYFEYIKYHDQIKNQYCKNNDINLLRIPYWEGNNIEDIISKHINL